jgi:similar to stage IV sporulation protein
MLRITNYANGVVRIKIRGSIPEKFINLCLIRGILLWGIKRQGDDVQAYLRLPDFFRIRSLARKSQTHIQVLGYSGLPFMIKRLKRRKMMFVGAVLFFILLQIMTSYIWFVDVTGYKELSPGYVAEVAKYSGLRPGVSRENVDVKAIENDLLLNIPEVAWVGINIVGTRAVIEIVEKTMPKQADKSPANIIASKDGVITEIIAIAGQPAVKKGDTVKKGDVLVKGMVQNAPPTEIVPGQPAPVMPPPQLVRANGIVKARVWYESYGEASLLQEYWERTGRQTTAVQLAVGGHQLNLKKVPPQPYDRFETEVVHKKLKVWRNSELTVESTIDIFHELNLSTREISIEEARELAKGKALQVVQQLIPESAQLVSRNIEIIKTAEPGIARVKIAVETVEDIGQTINITQ